MAKTAAEHLIADKQPKIVTMDRKYAGIQPGQTMYVATPKIVDSAIKKIPFGQTRTIERFRRELARNAKCDGVCPMSTSIFIRISAQAAIDELNDGKKTEDVTPFWRLLTSKDKIAKKLDIDSAWVDAQRALEHGV